MSEGKKEETNFSINNKGQQVDPFTGEPLVSIKELKDAAKQIPQRSGVKVAANQKMQELLAKGWRIQAEVAQETGLGSILSMRTVKLKPENTYLPNGCQAKQQSGSTVQGKDLFWKHPANLHIVLLAPSYWQAVVATENKHKSLLEKKYKLQSDVMRESKLQSTTLAARTAKIDPEKDYLPNGLPPLGIEGEVTVKGEILRWQHPHNKDVTLLSPEYAESIIAAEEKKRVLKEQGYLDQQAATEKIGVQVRWRTQKIDPDADYLPDGTKPRKIPGEVTVKGSVLRWQHPNDKKIILLSKEYVDGMWKAEKKCEELKTQGYWKQDKAAKELKLSYSAITKIDTNRNYLPNGFSPLGTPGEVTLKGSEIRWVHPYDSNIVLLRESYVNALLEAEQKKTELLSQKYQKQHEVAAASLLTSHAVAKRSSKILPEADYLPDGRKPTGKPGEITVKGNMLYWRHPFDRNTILLHPAYAAGIIAAEEKCRELMASGYKMQGDIARTLGLEKGNPVFPDYTRKGIKPDDEYLSNGNKPARTEGETILKGSQVRWQHPYNQNTVLLHPDYANALIKEFEGRKQAKIRKDALDGATEQISSDKMRIQKASPAVKIGDADESKLPDEVKQKLEAKRKHQREK